jgi:AcrR family transcriptional regulator
MDELAAEAGITKPILYSHFGDKAGLARALAERVAAELNVSISASLSRKRDPSEMVAETIDAFCTFVQDEPDLYRFLVQTALDNPTGSGSKLVADFANEIAVVLGGALRKAGADSGPAEPWAFAIVGLALAGAGWWIERQSMSKTDLVGYLSQLLWTGLSGAGLDRLEGRAMLPQGEVAPPGGNVMPLPSGRLGATGDG